ncbi:TetR/AcrR family transcriptional regulator [Diaminobutyricimonas aerilata]|uniref:TetR/AcrR family transcriptional regulator n=1 Tax=Diaminobutyricimonas aerilata TaxID=1162967 RepID=UPI001FE384D8|nr:TetR/AcrR family transcriptional regulator [Diaminobutyricimonas aerilata]
MPTPDELRRIALEEFAHGGYLGTSLQRIAEAAGTSKSSVLYHYASKETLLEAAIDPTLDAFERLVDRIEAGELEGELRGAFIAEFVDLLLEHRLQVHLFINQGRSLEDVPVIVRGNALIERIGTYFHTAAAGLDDAIRFGVALGGAAYSLVAAPPVAEQVPPDEIRAALIRIVTELLTPARLRPTSP